MAAVSRPVRSAASALAHPDGQPAPFDELVPVLAQEPCKGQKMRKLPQEHNHEKRPTSGFQPAARGCPTPKDWECSWNRSNHRRKRMNTFKGCIDEIVHGETNGGEYRCQRVYRQGQVHYPKPSQEPREHCGRDRRNPTRWYRSTTRAKHQSINISLQNLIHRACPSRHKRDTHNRVHKQERFESSSASKGKACGSRYEN